MPKNIRRPEDETSEIPMKDSLLVTGVVEIVLSVRNLPRMRDFYMDVLGFDLLKEACYDKGVVPTPGGAPTISFLTIIQLDTPLGRHGHPQTLALIDFQRHGLTRERFTGHDPTKSTLHHLAFEIPPESYEPHRKRLEALGLNPREVKFPDTPARALFFNDPEGNVLELICHDQSTVVEE